jgi:hypothetical protein
LASVSSGAQLPPPSPSSSSAATATAVSPPEPKRGLIQRFVSEKDIGASSVRKVRPPRPPSFSLSLTRVAHLISSPFIPLPACLPACVRACVRALQPGSRP